MTGHTIAFPPPRPDRTPLLSAVNLIAAVGDWDHAGEAAALAELLEAGYRVEVLPEARRVMPVYDERDGWACLPIPALAKKAACAVEKGPACFPTPINMTYRSPSRKLLANNEVTATERTMNDERAGRGATPDRPLESSAEAFVTPRATPRHRPPTRRGTT